MYLTQPRTAILFDEDMNSSITDLTTKQQILRRDDIPTHLQNLAESVISLIGGIQ
jgi:hypothetical protein